MSEVPAYKRKDFISGQEVRWCPGCGDYSILAAIQTTMTKLNKKREDIVFISGIGCSSRFPYYMNTFGLHTIHGRAPGFATGLKVTNPDLSIWLITGDGDALSIGGNHTIHMVRRNADINVVLFNNEIYGLTKGQYSPTSKLGTVTKSSPFGSIDRPFNPAKLVMGSNGTFFARTIDSDIKHLQETLLKASKHKGTSFVEVLQNCVIFNDKVHDSITNKLHRADTTLQLEHDKPMIFGKNRDKGIMVNDLEFKVVTIGEDGITVDDLLVHNEKEKSGVLAYALSSFKGPEFPIPMGVYRAVAGPTYDDELIKQINFVQKKMGPTSMEDLLNSGSTWEVK